MAKVRIPTPLRTLTQGIDVVDLTGANVDDILKQLSDKFPGIDKRLYKNPGELNRFVNVYVNDEDIRFLDNLTTQVKETDEVSIVPAIAGG